MNQLKEAILIWLEDGPLTHDELLDLLTTGDLCSLESLFDKALKSLLSEKKIKRNDYKAFQLIKP